MSQTQRVTRSGRRSRRADAKRRPKLESLEERTLLTISVLDVSVLEGNNGPVTVSGTLDPDNSGNLYRFQGSAGQQLYFDNVSYSSTAAHWYLYPPDGGYLTYANIGNDFTYTLPFDGEYALVFDSDGATPLDYEFRVFDMSPEPGALSGLGRFTGGIAVAGEVDSYTVDAPAGTRLVFDSLDPDSDNVYVRIQRPDGSYLVSNHWSSSDAYPWWQIDQSGPHKVEVYDFYGGVGGDYDFELRPFSDMTTPISSGETRSGDISDYGLDIYTFDASVGQILFFDGLEGSNWDVRARIYDPTGQNVTDLATYDDGGFYTVGKLGSYTVFIDGYYEASAGSYSFRMLDLAASATPFALDTEVNGTLDPGRSTDLHSFTGVAGQSLYFDAIAGSSAYWYLYRSDGTYLNAGNWIGGDFEYTIPADGTYYLGVLGYGESPDSYTFRVRTPESTTQSIAVGDTISGEIADLGDTHAYTFSGTAGQVLFFDGLIASSWDVYATLYDPTGDQAHVSTSAYTDQGPFVLTETGTYTLRIDGYYQNSLGSYEFRLLDVAASATPFALDTDVNGTLDPGTSAEFHSFDATAGQRLYFDGIAGSSASWYLYRSDGTYLNAGNWIGGDFEYTIPADGTYYLGVLGSSGSPDAYTFNVRTPETTTQSIGIGEIVSGALAELGDVHAYTFFGTAGQVLFFDGLTASSWDVYATLYDPTGDQAHVSTSAYTDQGPFVLTETGAYTLRIDGYYQNSLGTYEFRLLDVAASATPFALDTDVNGTLDPGTSAEFHSFDATAGQRLYFDGIAGSSASWYLYRSDGTYLNAGNWIGGDFEYTIPADGTYYLGVLGSSGSPDAYTFHVRTPESTTQTLTLGDTISGSIAEVGDSHEYTFTGTIGQVLFFDGLEGSNWDVYATLYDPTGDQAHVNTSAYSDVGPFVLTETGTYTLRIDGYYSGTTGTYGFRVLDLSAATALSLGVPISDTLTPGSAATFYTFNATNGQRYDFNGMSGTPTWNLYGPGGYVTGTYDTSLDFAATLPLDGTYYLGIFGEGGDPAPYTFTVTKLSDPTGSVSGLATFTGEISVGGEVDSFNFTAPAGTWLGFDSLDPDFDNIYARIKRPSGSYVINGHSASNDGYPWFLDESGTYTLEVYGSDGSSTGDYDFRLLQTPNTATPLAIGNTATGDVTNEFDLYSFTGTVGQILWFDGLETNNSAQVSVYTPSGALIFNQYTNADAGPYRLNEAGTYTIVTYSPYWAGTSTYAFRFVDAASATGLTTDNPVNDSIDPGTATALYSFQGTAGQSLFFDTQVGPSANWYVYKADGTYANVGNWAGYDLTFTPPIDGTYYLAVYGYSGSPVDISFVLREFSSIAGGAITPGTAVGGSITDPAQSVEYTFTGSIGQILYFDGLLDSTGGYLYARLYDPTGDLVHVNTWTGTDVGPFRLNEAGAYRLVVSAYDNQHVGDYSFRLLDLADAATFAIGDTVGGTLDPGNSTTFHAFNGAAGQHLLLNSLQGPSANWYLYRPDGSYMNVGNWAGYDLSATLPLDGTYYIGLIGYGGSPTDYSFSVHEFTEIENGGIFLDSTVSGSISQIAQSMSYEFVGAVGQILYFDGLLDSTGGYLYARLYDPTGDLVHVNTWTGTDVGPFRLSEAGTYRIVVSGYYNDNLGDYSFRLLDLASATPVAVNDTVAGQLDPGNSSAFFSFTGTAGERLFLNTTASPQANWYIYKPDGTYANVGNWAGYNLEFTPALDGTYYVGMIGYGGSPVDYSFEILQPVTVTQALPLNEIVSGVIGSAGETDVYTFSGTTGDRMYLDGISDGTGGWIYARLYDPTGTLIHNNWMGYDSNPLRLTETGTYRLEISSYDLDHTGSYSFRMLNLADQTEVAVGQHKMAFTVLLSAPNANVVSVSFATTDGTATAGEDYVARSGQLGFAPGVTQRTVIVPIVGDTLLESDETLALNLSNAVNDTILDGTGIGTILNDDTVVSVDIDDVTQLEGNSGTTTFLFTVSISPASAQTVTVDYATADGTATAGSDYTAISGTLTFLPGETTKTIAVEVNGDTVGETNETFLVNLSNATNAILGDAQGQGTILNDDATISVADLSQAEGDGGTTNFVVTVSLSAASSQTVTANYTTQDISANAGGDYTAASGTVTFDPGETSKTITISVVADSIAEPNETFRVKLSSATNATIADDEATVTILNDDAALSISNVGIVEGNSGSTNAQFVVSIPYASTKTVTVNYATADGTATAGSDYTAASGTVTINPGETFVYVNVAVNGDTTPEPDETFLVNLSGATNASIADAQGVGTIYNDDSTIAIADASAIETNGNTTITFTVSLTVASVNTITVDYATADGTATSGSDYTAASGTVTFNPGDTSKTIVITILGDTTPEAYETFVVNLSNATNALIADAQATGTIQNDDTNITIADASVVEGNSGTVGMGFAVSLSHASALPVTVDFATANGTATAGSDYTAASGTVTFNPGVTSQTVLVNVQGDTTPEAHETLQVNLSNATNGAISDAQATGTIQNDDAALSINSVSITEGDIGTVDLIFTVSLPFASVNPVSVDYATANGSAIAGSDYTAKSGTVTIPAGSTSATIAITILRDTLDENDETFTVDLSNPVNASITAGQGTGTILDDDPAPSLSIDDVSQTEGGVLTFTVSLSAASGKTITVNYATANGTAVAPGDYTAASGSLTFAPGVTTQTINVTSIQDTLDENDETFTVALSGASNATIADASATGTIVDNDPAPSLSINDVSQTEGGVLTFTVSLSAASGKTITVNYATADGTAVAPGDYTTASGTLTFAPGVTTQTINVTTVQDDTPEGDETFTVALSGASNATLADASATGTIVDDDEANSFIIDDGELGFSTTPGWLVSGLGGFRGDSLFFSGGTSSDMATWTFNVTPGVTYRFHVTYPSNASSSTVAPFAILDGATVVSTTLVNQRLAPDDLTANGTTWERIGGDITATASTMTVRLSAPGVDGVVRADAVRMEELPTLSIDDVTITEPATGTATATFTVSLSAPSANDVTVTFATNDGTATAGSDYTGISPTTLTIPAGSLTGTISVTILSDLLDEDDETFTVVLSSPSNATIADASATGTIVDDDPAPSLSIDDVSQTEGGVLTFTVSLSAASGKTITVNYATADGTAVAPGDYTAASGSLTFAPGVTTQTINVTSIQDTLDENDETFTVALSGASNATIADASATGTIVDDDEPVSQFVIDDGDPGFATVGNWLLSGLGGFQGDSRYVYKGTASDIATWTFTVTPGTAYHVYATYPAHSSSSTVAPFDVLDGTTVLTSEQINQRLAPDDFAADGADWEHVGGTVVSSSGTLIVRLRGNGVDGSVRADGVRLEEAPATPGVQIIDDGDPGFSTVGTWLTSGLGGFQADSRFNNTNSASQWADWTFNVTPGESYLIYVTYPAHSTSSTQAPFTILDTGVTIGSELINQRLAPDDLAADGASWEQVGGRVTMTGGTLVVRVAANGVDGVVRADAVRIEVAPTISPTQIIDDGDPGFSTVGTWLTSGLGGFQADSRFNNTNSTSQWAEWSFNVTPGESYRVFVTYPAHPTSATMAPFSVRDGALVLGSELINQRLAPDDLTADGASWEQVGGRFMISGNTLVVRLTANGGDGVVRADAVRIEVAPPIPTVQIVDDGDLGYATVGAWLPSNLGGYQGDSQFYFNGTNSQIATWTFDVEPGQTYRVYTTYPAHPSSTTRAQFSILDGVTLRDAELINQRLAPNDLTADGADWEQVGGNVTISGGVLVVRLSALGVDGSVRADAIRIEKMPRVVDDGDPGFTATGNWLTSGLGGFQGDSLFHQPGNDSQVATWSFQVTPGRTYRVYTTYPAHPTSSSMAPFSIYSGLLLLGSESINQRLAPDDLVADGAFWEQIAGDAKAVTTTLTVRLTANGVDGSVRADAVRIEPVPEGEGNVVLGSGTLVDSQRDGTSTVQRAGSTGSESDQLRLLDLALAGYSGRERISALASDFVTGGLIPVPENDSPVVRVGRSRSERTVRILGRLGESQG